MTWGSALGARHSTARAVLEGLVDYAGLFPPAGLGMAQTVANYAAYQRREDHWALGRLVVPVARLGEFEEARAALSEQELLGTRWPLTALLGADLAADAAALADFRERHAHGGPQVLSLEGKVEAGAPPRIRQLAEEFGGRYEVFVELPLGDATAALMASVREAGLYAKIRTGGVTEADFPSPDLVLGFLSAAARHRVAFKATAGLHHPIRGSAPLTYAPGSACALMYGYLNVLAAATALWQGAEVEDARTWLTLQERTLHLGEEVLSWGGRTLAADALAAVRKEFFRSIGSCSFTEPLDEIRPFLQGAT